MPSVISDDEGQDEDTDDFLIFPLTEINGSDNSNDADNSNSDDDFDAAGRAYVQRGMRGSVAVGWFRPAMTLKGRRRSLLSGGCGLSLLQEPKPILSLPPKKLHGSKTSPNLRLHIEAPAVTVTSMSPRERWKYALRMIHTLKDPWAEFPLDELPVETATRHRYNALKRKWVLDKVTVKMETEPFNHGAMRSCFRLKKLDGVAVNGPDWKQQGRNFVAKVYMENVERDVYFEDVRLQMDAKLWGEEYNRHRPPKKVDILQMSIIEFTDRPGSPLFHLEHFVDGEYIKYNSNSGFVEESLRLTPQAFSHFTFERSSHKMIVVDIQGVGDLWTDPQIHTSEGTGYGDGNLGVRGMALFFHSHICNCICATLKLSKFDLAPSETSEQTNFIKMQKSSATRVRGVEEICYSASPVECADFAALFARRARTISSNSSVLSDDSSADDHQMSSVPRISYDEMFSGEPMSIDLAMSPTSPLSLSDRHRKFLTDSDDSSSATTTEEEERRKFHQAARAGARPSCVAKEIDIRNLQNFQYCTGDSVLGRIHHELAIYHEIGRFCGQGNPFDVEAAMFHEQQAAELGIKDAVLTLAKIHLGLPHDTLSSISVENSTSNQELGVDFMLTAAHAGDRGAMLYVAKAYESGTGLGNENGKCYREAVNWYEKAANMTREDESGEFDATMDDPLYQIKATMAYLYLAGEFGLEKDASYAGELFTEAAEAATTAMKGRLASKYYAMAEEAWAQVEG